ncbi:MAG: hypothetical protein C0391_08960, partial [Anaerolinea sp.]|nr:hypothetical protein [Anaerolinea sp.]
MPQSNKTRAEYDPLTDNPLSAETPVGQEDNRLPAPDVDAGFHRLNLKSPFLRIATAFITLALIAIVVLLLKSFFLPETTAPKAGNEIARAVPTIPVELPFQATDGIVEISYTSGIPRLALLHTIIPDRPRQDIVQYTVVEGDTVFGIAEKFGLKPETILNGNIYSLGDNPSFIQPGQELNILPVDGIYWRWAAGNGLNGFSEFFKVSPEDIINYPLNHLDINTIGDFRNPNIADGTMLVIPNGTRGYISWTGLRITREDPAVAKLYGPGFCGTMTDGPVGVGVFIWPTNNHFLSGFDYSPETNHFGIDLDGETGDPIYAID